MLEQFFALMPDADESTLYVVGSLAALAGTVVWLFGARFSRFILALALVAIGGLVGSALPGWLGWSVSGAVPAVTLAVGLGVSAFLLHLMWSGVVLGLTAALWAAFVTWCHFVPEQTAQWGALADWYAARSAFPTPTQWWDALSAVLPTRVSELLPYVVGAGVVTGLSTAILWNRFIHWLAWASFGTTLLLGGICTLASVTRHEWVMTLADKPNVQAAIVVGFVVLGTLIQRTTTGDSKKTPGASKEENEERWDAEPAAG